MATKTVSPGAALLRTSRMFSLPSQLPPAPADAAKRASNSATRPFPTMQAIASPKSSRSRGDWGFKRPLPAKLDASSRNPLVRVLEIDSAEQITDFATATDHAQTLRKWQELNVPITMPTEVELKNNITGKSVFEEDDDIIAIDEHLKHTAEDKRWKYQGPWLAGITEGAFQTYLKKQVRMRRAEFREFLRAQLAADTNAAAAAKAMDAGVDAAAPITPADISDAEFTEYLRALRHDRGVLYRLVGKFLDLAPLEPSGRVAQNLHSAAFTSSLAVSFGASPAPAAAAATPASLATSSLLNPTAGMGRRTGTASRWAQDGPPITHPSAGLSYLRTNAYLENHPLYGPQKAHQPVQARIVAPRSVNGALTPKLGVGGFIAESPFQETFHNTRYSRNVPGLNGIDPSIVGGAKVPVRVASAKINSQGHVLVKVAEADPEAVLVHRELEGKETIYGQPSRLLSTRAPPPRIFSGYTNAGRPASSSVISSPRTYGL